MRDYWQNREDCPPYFKYEHGMLKDFWWNQHLRFIPHDIDKYDIPHEDLDDKWFKWLEKTWQLHILMLSAIIWLTLGWEAMVYLVFFRVSASIIAHWFIGFVIHKYGYQRFEIQKAYSSGYNNYMLGLISFGEGFHNNHHAHPSSAKMGLKWYELDIGWMVISLLEKLGLVWDVKAPGRSETLRSTAVSKTKMRKTSQAADFTHAHE